MAPMRALAAERSFPHTLPASPEAYIRSTNKGLDAIDASLGNAKGKAPLFSADHFLGQGQNIRYSSIEALNAYTDGLKASGAQLIEFFAVQTQWPDKDPKTIAKYDSTIAHARKLGLQIGFDPTVDPPPLKGGGYVVWKPWALAAYVEMARRYQPEKFSVLHEPAAMNARLREQVSPETWAAFAGEACDAIHTVSPKTQSTVGVLPFEHTVFEALIKVPQITSVGFDVYAVSEIAEVDAMIAQARSAGKSVHMAETWRPHWEGLATVGGDATPFVPYYVGDERYVALDQHWLKTMVHYAAVRGMDAIMPFCTTAFFVYVPTGPDASEISKSYIQASGNAAIHGKRTPTFDTYKTLIKSYDGR